MNQKQALEVALRNLMGAISIGEIMSNKKLVESYKRASASFSAKGREALMCLKDDARGLVQTLSPVELRTNPRTRTLVMHITAIIQATNLGEP